jgi:hypothetical protein
MNAIALTNTQRQLVTEDDPVFSNASESMRHRYKCYLSLADDGSGGDVTRSVEPLFTFAG